MISQNIYWPLSAKANTTLVQKLQGVTTLKEFLSSSFYWTLAQTVTTNLVDKPPEGLPESLPLDLLKKIILNKPQPQSPNAVRLSIYLCLMILQRVTVRNIQIDKQLTLSPKGLIGLCIVRNARFRWPVGDANSEN